jgi:hypothetical protein
MEKTLYLSENQTLRIRCDGPSLWVQQAHRAAQRIPARLVRRAIVVGNVPLDSASLTLLAQRGVPITLFNRRGEPLAMVLGLRDGAPQRRARQAALSEDREKRERIAAWLDAWERGRQLRAAKRLDAGRTHLWRRVGFRRADYEELISSAARARGRHVAERVFLRGALQELVAAEIAGQDWDLHTGVRHHGETCGFVKDCASPLYPEADVLWLALPAPKPNEVRVLDTRRLAEHFEATRKRLEALVRLMLEQYARLLWEI